MPALALQHLLAGHDDLDFCHSLFCDSEPSCRSTAVHLFNPSVMLDDAKKWPQVRHINDLDMFWHSPCCYDYTSNSKQLGFAAGERGKLIQHSLKFVVATKPKIVGFEQVRNILFKKHKWIVAKMKRVLRKAGYRVKCGILDSALFGNPQSRRRFYMIALRRDVVVEPMRWPSLGNGSRFKDIESVLDPFGKTVDKPMRLPPHGQENTVEPNRERKLVLKAIGRVESLYKMRCKNMLRRLQNQCASKRNCCAAVPKSVKRRVVKKMKARCDRKLRGIVCDIGSSTSRFTFRVHGVPVVTKTRGGRRDYWVLCRGRRPTLKELVRWQGLRSLDVDNTPASSNQLGTMVGNSIPFEVLGSLIRAAPKSVGNIL